MNQHNTVSRMLGRRERWAFVLNVTLGVAAVVAVAALVLEYGFRTPPIGKPYLHAVQSVVVGIFVLDRVLRLLLARRRVEYLKENWTDFALILGVGVCLIVLIRMTEHVLSAGALYLVITQVYILATLILRGVGVNLRFAESGIHPTWLLIGSFAFLSVAGSGLLMLPRAAPEGQQPYYIDSLFTAVSATCVTGLIVRDTGTEWTPFGQAVILVLIQLGGLGIMVFGTVLALLVGKGLSLRGSDTMGQIVGTEGLGRLGRTVKFVLLVTLLFELAGAIGFLSMFRSALDANGRPMAAGMALWHSVFHSISSFCNAGFALYGNNMMHGVREGWDAPLRSHAAILGVMAPLIVFGGLGFPVLQDCAKYVRGQVRRVWRLRRRNRAVPAKTPRPRLSLHSKIVLATSAALIVLGAVVLVLVEPRGEESARIGRHPFAGAAEMRRGDWRGMPTSRRIREALFQSITARTAGFNTIDMGELSNAGKLSMCGLMIVGGSPASTAGGMKTVTFALLILTAYSVLRRRREVEAFRRSLSYQLLRRTVTLAVLYLSLVAVVTLLLCAAKPGARFIDMLFEACSACGTVGLSTGATRGFEEFGKCVIIAGMFIGRLGLLTLLLALTSRIRHVDYAYPTEDVVIG